MKTDLLTLSALTTQAIFKMPPLTVLHGFLQINDISQRRAALYATMETMVPHLPQDFSEEQLEHMYLAETERILPQLSPRLCVAQWLMLQADFHIIKQSYIAARLQGAASYFSTIKDNPSLKLLANYESLLLDAETGLHALDDTFMFVNTLDRLYLMTLLTVTNNQSTYVHQYVQTLVRTYNIMTMLRLTQLGKSRTVIAASLLSQVGDYSLETLKNLPDGDVIGDVAQLLQLPLEKTSIHDIERHLYHQQVRALNHAIFSGGNEDRLMQYFGKLQFFLYDVKLLLSGMALNMSNEMIQSRLIDYDLL